MNPRYVLTLVLVFVLLLLPAAYTLILHPGKAGATWFDDGYHYRQRFTFTHNATVSADRKITFTFDTAEMIAAGIMQSDCDDTRFTDINGKLLNFDLTGTCNNAATTYEIIFPNIINGTNVGYIYYGNPLATNVEVDSTGTTALTPSGGDPASITDRTNEVASPGPTAFWKFDESANDSCSGGSNDACDQTSNGKDLAKTNGTWTSKDQCVSGTCLNFDGSGDYLTRADDSDFDFTASDSFTISGWFKHAGISAIDYIVGKHGVAGSDGGYKVYMDADGDIVCGIDDDDTFDPDASAGTTNANYDDSTWHYFSCVKNGNSSLTLYIDGSQVNQNTSISGVGSLANADALYVGNDSTGTSGWDGYLDEVKIYRYARSASEVKTDTIKGATSRGSSAVLGKQKNDLLSQGLIGYWPMDETGANTCSGGSNDTCDKSGQGNDGAWQNGATFTTGLYGAGVAFDGTTDDVQILNSTSLDTSATDMTISLWMKANTVAATKALFSKRSTNGTLDYELFFNSAGTLQFLSGESGVNGTASSAVGAITTGKWIHVVLVKTSTAVIFYTNGQLLTTVAYTGSWTNSDRLHIGSLDNSFNNSFDGTIDDVRLYNRALSTQEIASLAGSQVLNWKFDENYSTTANDTGSGNASNGTLTNMSSPATTTSGWTTSGKYSSGLLFDGTNDRVSLATASDSEVDFNAAEPFSGSAWVYVTTMPGSGEQDAIITKWDDTSNQAAYKLYVTNDDGDTTGNFAVQVYDESASQALTASQSNDLVSTNTWYHVMFTFNGGIAGAAGDLKLYVNGHLIQQNTVNASFLGIEDLGSDFAVGDYDTTDAVATNTAFTGKIDEVKMYSALLTDQEVEVDYNANSTTNFSNGTVESAQSTDGTGTSPIIYLNMDENTGATAVDHSGNGLDAALRQTYAWQPGYYGSGIHFDGSETSVNTSGYFGTDIFDGYTVGTMGFWFKPDDTGDDFQDMFSMCDTACNNNGIEFAYERSTDRVNVWTTGCDGGTNIEGYSALPGTQTAWHYFTWVANGSGNKMYIDGIQVTVTYTSGSSSTNCFFADIDENTDYSFLACASVATSTCYDGEMYEGKLDEFKFYNYARTNSQIWYDYNRGAPLAQWKMDDCQATTANDSSGNTYTGTVTIGATSTYTSTGTCGSGTSTEAWNAGTTGKRNYAIGLDGTDDYVQVSDSTNLRFNPSTQDFSIFAWVKRTTTGTEYIISKEDADNDGWRMMFNSSNLVLCSEDNTDVTSTSAITDTNWHHIGCTIDRDGNGQVYIDGQANGTATAMGTDAMATTSNIRIGTRSYTSTNYFAGLVDDVRLYPYALTPIQVKLVKNDASTARFGPDTGAP
ncbi:MAG: LamG domain-containing protein [Patescibacteria group bacterium]